MSGTILGIYNKKFVVQPTDSKPNRNVLVLGGPGSYKTQSYVITNIFNETENSLVVTDPKGEVYEYTADVKRRWPVPSGWPQRARNLDSLKFRWESFQVAVERNVCHDWSVRAGRCS